MAYSNIIRCDKKPFAEENLFIIYQSSKFFPQGIWVHQHRMCRQSPLLHFLMAHNNTNKEGWN
jgi:hypothetical protein